MKNKLFFVVALAAVGSCGWFGGIHQGKLSANLTTRNRALQEMIEREREQGTEKYSRLQVLAIIGRAARPRSPDKNYDWADWVEHCESMEPVR